jgi:hypothetical protein
MLFWFVALWYYCGCIVTLWRNVLHAPSKSNLYISTNLIFVFLIERRPKEHSCFMFRRSRVQISAHRLASLTGLPLKNLSGFITTSNDDSVAPACKFLRSSCWFKCRRLSLLVAVLLISYCALSVYDDSLLGCCAVQYSRYWATFQRRLLPSSSGLWASRARNIFRTNGRRGGMAWGQIISYGPLVSHWLPCYDASLQFSPPFCHWSNQVLLCLTCSYI